MSDRLPLAEVSGDEVLARVAYQVILFEYRQKPDAFDNPTETLLQLAHQWHLANLHVIAEQIALCAIWVGNGGTVATWLRARIIFQAGRTNRLARVGRSRQR